VRDDGLQRAPAKNQRYLAGRFEGWLNWNKYSKMADCSPDTAQRDLADLLARGVIIANDASARRTSYRLPNEFDPNAVGSE
jgi:Fic family protein